MKKIWILVVVVIFLGFIIFKVLYNNKKNWDTLTFNDKSCGMEGSAKNDVDKKEYALKNRWQMPLPADFDTSFSWGNIYDGEEDPRKFNQLKAGKLKGYVAYISKSDSEFCNCDFKDDNFYDYHISIVPDKEYINDKTQHLIVEVTPRLREIMKEQHIDWDFKALKQKLRHHQYIEVEGWIFYDWDHGDKAYMRTGDSLKSWRATCWELHPVTGLKVLEEAEEN